MLQTLVCAPEPAVAGGMGCRRIAGAPRCGWGRVRVADTSDWLCIQAGECIRFRGGQPDRTDNDHGPAGARAHARHARSSCRDTRYPASPASSSAGLCGARRPRSGSAPADRGSAVDAMLQIAPFHAMFAVAAPLPGWPVARASKLPADQGRAVAFSTCTPRFAGRDAAAARRHGGRCR